MKKIIEFVDIHSKMLGIFQKIEKDVIEIEEELKNDKYYIYLINYFYDIYGKLKNNKWSNSNDLKFINKFGCFEKNDKVFECINEIEYVRLYDMFKEKFINLDEQSIHLFMYIPYEFQDLNKQEYEQIIKYMSNKIIKDSINKETNFKRKKDKIIDYIDLYKNGYNIIEIALEEANKKCDQCVDNLDIGVLSIDRIYNYYINQAYNLKKLTNSIPSEYVINNIEKIKKLDNVCYNKFVILMRFSQSISKNLIENLENISNCVDIILYYKNDIDRIDIETLKQLLVYKIINKLDISEIDILMNK